MAARPILVTGAPRSGTTWVGEMLAHAPGVGYIHEPFNPLTDPGLSGRAFDHFLAHVTDRDGHLYAPALERCLRFSYDWRRQLPTVRSPRQAARTARDSFRYARLRAAGARPLVKDPIAVFSAPWLARRFDMDVVLTVRRPTAFVASFKRLGWTHDFAPLLADDELMAGRLAPFAEEVQAEVERPSDVVSQATLLWRLIYATVDQYRQEHPDWLVVRQEDLSLEPVAGYRALYEQLGLQFSDSARAAIESHSSSSNPERLKRTHDTRLDSAASLQGWRSVLSDEETSQVDEQTADLRARFYPVP